MFNMPSGSSLERAMNCYASVVLPKVKDINEAADRGTALHEYLRVAKGGDREGALASCPEEYRAEAEAIDLSRLPVCAEEHAEIALAYDIATGKARVAGYNLGRNYGPLAPTEIPLSLDWVGVQDRKAIVLDYKTGAAVTSAKRNWQLKLGALAIANAMSGYGLQTVVVAAVYTRSGRPQFDYAEFNSFDLDGFAEDLRGAYAEWKNEGSNAANGDFRYTTGPHCKFCPSASYCVATNSLIRAMANKPGEVADEIISTLEKGDPRAAYKNLSAAKAALKAVEAKIDAYAKNTPIELGDGVVYGEKTGGGREEIDGAVAYDTLTAEYGQHIADEAVERSATKTSIKNALKGITSATSERDVFDAIRKAGGIKFKRFANRMGEFEK